MLVFAFRKSTCRIGSSQPPRQRRLRRRGPDGVAEARRADASAVGAASSGVRRHRRARAPVAGFGAWRRACAVRCGEPRLWPYARGHRLDVANGAAAHALGAARRVAASFLDSFDLGLILSFPRPALFGRRRTGGFGRMKPKSGLAQANSIATFSPRRPLRISLRIEDRAGERALRNTIPNRNEPRFARRFPIGRTPERSPAQPVSSARP